MVKAAQRGAEFRSGHGSDLGAAPGLYVHVPFCKTKCPYCDFYSTVEPSMTARWLDALSREAGLYTGTFAAFDTLYIGGGTPSLLSGDAVRTLLESLRRSFDFVADTEVTIEANPDDVTAAVLEAYRGLGINRLSLGVQSFDDAELRFLRRRHDAAGAERAISLARGAGFENLGIDLIFGFEGQSLASWQRTLDRALDFEPEHLSCYQMTIEHSTEFGRLREAGAMRELGEESQRRFYLAASERLVARGYVHYEISNYARGERFISRHNHKYWSHAPYLGLGPSAHSFQNGSRWWNARSVTDYCAAIEAGWTPLDGRESLTRDQIALERLYFGFRTREGIPLEDLRSHHGWKSALDELEKGSFVTVENGRALPTSRGFLIADQLPLMFTE